MQINDIIEQLRSLANPTPENLKGMARYGINTQRALCVSTPDMHKLGRQIGRNHSLALELWQAGWRETRILAAMTDDPALVTDEQMDAWVKDFDSWDVCDAACLYLFSWTSIACDKALQWSLREEEYVKRAGFTLMACLAVGKRKPDDKRLAAFLPAIEREAWDGRNYVKKSVNWALRQIGKYNLRLNKLAIESAERIKLQDTKSARWIATDALRELTSEQVQIRLAKRG
ncbi:MAG: DNA alkylation repair protein [Dehalococcoidia bacterium]